MKFKKYLKEEFFGSKKTYSFKNKEIDVEYFTNPTTVEMRDAQKASEMYKSIRFIVDFKKKKLIIWQGGILHKNALKVLNLTKFQKELFMGTATFSSGKMHIDGSDTLERSYLNTSDKKLITTQIEKNQKWLSKYFDNLIKFTDLIKRIITCENNIIKLDKKGIK